MLFESLKRICPACIIAVLGEEKSKEKGKCGIEFRKADSRDITVLIELRKQQLADEGLPAAAQPIDGALRDYFARSLADGSFISWVALESDRIIATSGICFYQLPPNYSNPSGRVAYVTNMFTAKPHRRKGIATILLEKTINEARLRGYAVVRLHASSDGEGLYTKFGFAPSEGYMALRL